MPSVHLMEAADATAGVAPRAGDSESVDLQPPCLRSSRCTSCSATTRWWPPAVLTALQLKLLAIYIHKRRVGGERRREKERERGEGRAAKARRSNDV